ncbi:protein TASOR 2 [Eublepharis macularius]|uniref:Protein TASOR 2 n=1 Tax=Eublepharis macularius TaxID=481883 RepID=A0AA97JW71_EUBMA|nr:protein TASOR 2 [Eublepharis macularius]
MSPLNRKKLTECKTTALYCAWKGQLFIQEQRVCDLALWSPFSSTIPAQLPAKLEARYVVAVSDLRKKLPEVAFGKNNYANDEVHSQGIWFSLYEVEILNQNEMKVDQLIESLKEKDLALVRYLNEHGILILLASSALIKEKDAVPDDCPCLQALFVVSSPGPARLTAKDLRCDHRVHERSSQVPSVLPALQYALAEAAKDHKKEGVPFGTLVKQHFQEFVTIDKNLLPTLTELDRPSFSFDQFLKKSDLEAVSGKCPPSSFSHLQLYLLDPQNYTLEMSMASACSDFQSPNSSRTRDAGSSSGLRSDTVPPQGPGQPVETTRVWRPVESTAHSTEDARKSNRTNERALPHCKRKSSRLLGASARKKWAPLKILYITESNKKRKKSRKKKLDFSSTSSKTQGPSADSEEPTLKLKNLQYPIRRKRGAEVLSAEFVQKTRHESATKASSASEGPGAEQKKPRLLNCRKSLDAEKVEKIYKRQTIKKKCVHHKREEIESKNHCDENGPSSERPASQEASPALRRDECDSHALNMLADLALSSCDSVLLSNANRSGLSNSLSREHRHLPRGKLLRKASDHEYHRINQKWKGAPLSGRNYHWSLSAHLQPDPSVEPPSSPRDRGRVGSGKKKSARPHPAKSHEALPMEPADSSDSGVPSLISSEHSYASLASEPLKKQLPWRGSLSPPNSNNGVKNAKSRPLVGKVLPFRHQQNICHPHKQFRAYLPSSRSAVMAARLKEDFWKSHKVTFCNQTVRVTCQWEAEYFFRLDSKYTNNSLERTVIRAVHGPWDESLSDDMEEMKLILHTWVALFYSKPLRSPTARKVVEHSNPAKYVSLNSVVDPFELIDDSEEPYDSEKCPADVFSEAYRMPGKGEERASSPVEKPLSCSELSSTNCIEYEAPPADPAETSLLLLKDGAVGNVDDNLIGLTPAFDEVTGEDPEDEFLLGPVISVHSESSGSLNGQGGGCPRPDMEAEANEAVHSVDVFQIDSASALVELPEATTVTQVVADARSVASTEKLEIDNAVLCAKEKDSCQISSTELLRTARAMWLEASTEDRKGERPCRRGESQDLPVDEDEEDGDGESVELVSIDLALSDSNDADGEPRDVDLDQDGEDLPQGSCVAKETCVCDVASSGDSLTTSTPSPNATSPHQPAPRIVIGSPGDQEDPAGLDQKPAFVEGFCELQDTERDGLADSAAPQAVPFHRGAPDEVTELTRIEDSVVSPVLPMSPHQTDLVERPCFSQEDKGISLADSVSLQTSELNQIKNDLVTPESSVGSQEASLVLEKSQTFSHSLDLVGVSKGGKEINRVDSALQQIDLVHQPIPDEIPELPGSQEASATSTECSVSLDQMNLIEATSQEDVPVDELACKLGQVRNSMPTEEENPNNSPVSAKNLATAKLDGLVGDSGVSQEATGTDLSDSAPLQNHSGHQTTPEEGAKLPGDQEDSVASTHNLVFPDQTGLDQGTCTDQGEEEMNAADAAPSPASHEAVQEGQNIEQMTDKEILRLGMDDSEVGAGSEGTKCQVQDANNGSSSVAEEIACDDNLNQLAANVSEEIKSFLCELIDSVSGLEVQSEGTSSKEHSGLDWISSMALECVTPPESDGESLTAGQLTGSDPQLVADEHLKQQSIFVDQEAELQEHGQCFAASHKGLVSHPAAVVEREPFQVGEAALAVLPSPCCADQAKMGTPSLDCKLAETAVSSKNNDPTGSALCGEVCVGPASHEASVLAREGPFREGDMEILPRVSEELDSPLRGGTNEGQKRVSSEDAVDVQLSSELTQLPAGVLGPNTNREAKSLLTDGDQELFGDPYCRNPSVSTCTRSTNSSGVSGANYTCDLRTEEEIGKSDDWLYLGKKKVILDVGPESKHYDWPFTCRRDNRSALPSLESDGEQGPLKDYINFSVTKKHKDRTRTFHSSKSGGHFMEKSGLINSLSRTWQVLEDPTQSTLDMECLRFYYKLKQILKNKRPQLSTSDKLFVKELAPQVIVEALPLRKVPEAPVLNVPPRSRSPLLITIVNPGLRQSAGHQCPRISRHHGPFDPPPPPAQDPFSKAARFKSQGQEWLVPFRLNKLTYNNKLKDCRGDISVIMDEFAELSRVMKSSDRQTSDKGRDSNTTSEDVPEKRRPFLPRAAATYEHLFGDLRDTLRFRLKNVAKEACKKPYSFYLVETDDDPFFGRIKNLLKKGNHLEADPQHFCKTSHPETDRLVVIIRNEDIFLRIHKVPSLLRLKHCPNVTFAGVDSPEDMLGNTYQELFHSGGFVVTDDQVLETMTMGQLKDMVKTLEQLNGQRKWRWLLHYKETKKLREDARVDPAAHSKDSILRSCQGANFTEVLHYHRCDSRSSPKSEYLNCLLNLQVQHISARLAVFLTEKTGASREALESKGILVLDVNTFVATAQDLAVSCRSNY